MSLSIAIASDLHTEVHPTSPEYTVCPNLKEIPMIILAGDIGNPHKQYGALELILSQIQKCYPISIYVPGNHEYNSDDPQQCLQTVDILQRLVDRLNTNHTNTIYLLSRDTLELQYQNRKICIIGATLWSQTKYHQSPPRDDFLSCQQRNILYQLDREYIEQTLCQVNNQDYDIIITVTHHPPVKDFGYGEAAEYYGSNNAKLCEMTDYWVCGHVHNICTFDPNYVNDNRDSDCLSKIIINPIGRFSEHFDRKVEFLEMVL